MNDLRRVALHEFGHVLGLDHPDEAGQSVTAIMNAGDDNTDGLQKDDTDGAIAIYGAPAPANQLLSGSRLLPGESLTSTNGRYRLLYQPDGILVLYDDVDEVALWATDTAGTSAGQAVMQSDGNFVVYDAQGIARWSTGTGGNANARLLLQDDGNLVVYSTDDDVLWDRISASTPAPTPAPTPDPTPDPTPGPTPTPTPGGTSVIAEGSFSLGWLDEHIVPFTTTATGTISITVDWTFATNDVDFGLARGICSVAQIDDNQCPILAIAGGREKPETLSVSNLTAGPYTLYIVNFCCTQESGPDPLSWTPNPCGRRSPRCRTPESPTRRSFATRWSRWCGRVARQKRSPTSLNQPLSRSATGWPKPIAMPVGGPTASPPPNGPN